MAMRGKGYRQMMDWHDRCRRAQTDVMHGLWRAEDAGVFAYAVFARRNGHRQMTAVLPGERSWRGVDRQAIEGDA